MRRTIAPGRVAATVMAALASLISFAAMAQDNVELVVPVSINTIAQGETPVIIASDDFYVPVSAFERASLAPAIWQRVQTVARLRQAERTAAGQPALSLRALSPWVSYAFDEANLSLSIVLNPSLLKVANLSVASPKPEDIVYSADSSAFVNYAVSGTRSTVSAFGEAGMNVRRTLLYSSFSRNEGQGFVRGMSSASFDDVKRLQRLTAGDTTVVSDELGGSAIVGGLTLSRTFDIDPYFVRYPALNLRGVATTPSQVEVYVNGMLVNRQSVSPGPFEIANVPASAGPSTAQIVVRDAFGREQTQSSSFYYSTSVLGRGLSDFIYSVGYQRESFGSESFDYDKPIALASHRYGLTDRVTIGGRIEAGEHVVSGGPSLAFASRFGDVDLKVAGSSVSGSSGAATSLSFRRLARRANFAGGIRLLSRDYANFSLRPEQDRPSLQGTLSAGYLTRWGNIGVQWTTSDMRDTARQDRLAITASAPIAGRFDLMVTAATTKFGSEERINEYYFGINLHAWQNSTVSVGAASADGRNQVMTGIQKSVPVGTGWGYRVQANSGEGKTDGDAAIDYQSRFGRYSVDAPLNGGDPSGSISGGVIYESGKVMPTRAVVQSFALVRVPGVPNVRVYLSNHLIGRTDARGDLLIPTMLAYYGNRVRIDDRDIPMNYDIQVVEKTIAPPNRGGALVIFDVYPVHAVSGSVTLTDSNTSVAYGQLTVTTRTGPVSSPLGAKGEFYFDNLGPATYQALVEYEKGSCSFSLTVPTSSQPMIDLGRVVCSGDVKR